jgi:TPR repeat protein
MKLVALAFSCLLAFAMPASASDADLYAAMLVLANKGDAEAQYHVGMMHNNGIGTEQDTKQAFQWFQKSASSNDPLGAYKLGCYYDGQGAGVVEANSKEALKYKLVSATAGYSLAQHDVALLYARQGNIEEAAKWMKMAGDQGFVPALYKLYSLYHDGKAVPQDLSLAFAYFKLGLMMSQTELNAETKAMLDGMLARMSDAELEKAQKMVLEWKPQPTDLTVKALNGISEAEAHLQKAK